MALIGTPLLDEFAKSLESTRTRLETGFATDTQTRDRVVRVLKSTPIKRVMERDEAVKADIVRAIETQTAEAKQRQQQRDAFTKALEQLQRDLEIVRRF
jgi:hypothetical protein